MRSPRVLLLLLLALITLTAASPAASDPRSDGPKVPVALAWQADGMLRVAFRDAREVATIDPKTWKVTGHHALPFRPVSLASSEDGKSLFVGGIYGEVFATGAEGDIFLRKANGKGPARVVSITTGRVAVTTTWERAVTILDARTARNPRSIALTFSPGATIRRPDGLVIVADAFAGNFAVVDPDSGAVRLRAFDGVNPRALAISGDRNELLIGHMSQFGAVPLTGPNIDWGLILSSRLSAVRLSEFDARGHDGDALARRRLTLDGSAHGAADPSAMVVARDGDLVLIALRGSHQILKNDRTLDQKKAAPGLQPLGNYQRLELVNVGRSPTDLILDPSGQFVVSADSMSDTLSVVRVDDLSVLATVRLGATNPAPNRTAEQRGEAHFLDGRRSMDRWMSCASCHVDGHSNGLNFDTLGDGGYGAAKNTPSLLGVGPTSPFSWTGRFATLEAQVHQSLVSSLRGPSAGEEIVNEISAYLRALPPPSPRRSSDEPEVKRGAIVFSERQCDRCHLPPTYTSAGVKYVALDDGPGGHTAFNAPSLLGVGWSAPYLHDGRASSLEEVLELHPPNLPELLSPAERVSLKAFLESL